MTKQETELVLNLIDVVESATRFAESSTDSLLAMARERAYAAKAGAMADPGFLPVGPDSRTVVAEVDDPGTARRLEELEKEFEELKADAYRLRWLIQSKASIDRDISKGEVRYLVYVPGHGWLVDTLHSPIADPRQAIDEARAKLVIAEVEEAATI